MSDPLGGLASFISSCEYFPSFGNVPSGAFSAYFLMNPTTFSWFTWDMVMTQPHTTRARGLSSVKSVNGVMMCFLRQPVTRVLSSSTRSGSVQGWYSITMAPCSMLWDHLCVGTNLRREIKFYSHSQEELLVFSKHWPNWSVVSKCWYLWIITNCFIHAEMFWWMILWYIVTL